MVTVAEDSSSVPRRMKTDDVGRLIVEAVDMDYHYKAITDDTSGTTGTVWDPAAGKSCHIVAIWVSVTDAGTVEIYDNASGTTIYIVEFGERKGSAIEIGVDLVLTADHVLGAKFTCDAGSKTAHITAIGHEH